MRMWRCCVVNLYLCCVVLCCDHRLLKLVGTLPNINVFRVSVDDLSRASNIQLSLPNYVQGQRMTVIINVMFKEDYTGAFRDPSGNVDTNRTKA